MPTSPIAASEQSIDRAASLLASGKLVAIPTETVYGLAANAWDAAAVQRIFETKGRPPTNPLIVHVASIDRLSEAIRWPLASELNRQLQAVIDLWPGPLTVVCPRGERIPDVVTAGRATVAVRIPSHPVALALLRRCPFPLAAPSANRSNYISPTRAEHVASLGDSVDMILDGGPCRHGVESTIIRLGEFGPVLLRPGAVTREELADRFSRIGMKLRDHTDDRSGNEQSESSDSAIAPGMLEQHYSPHTPLVLVDVASVPDVQPNTGRIAFCPIDTDDAEHYQTVITLTEDGNLEEVARKLFATLRLLDEQDLDQIHCDTCDEAGLGQAIMDRLRRAAAKQ